MLSIHFNSSQLISICIFVHIYIYIFVHLFVPHFAHSEDVGGKNVLEIQQELMRLAAAAQQGKLALPDIQDSDTARCRRCWDAEIFRCQSENIILIYFNTFNSFTIWIYLNLFDIWMFTLEHLTCLMQTLKLSLEQVHSFSVSPLTVSYQGTKPTKPVPGAWLISSTESIWRHFK